MSFGVDVSHYDGIINWSDVKNDPQEVGFMIAKVTQGSAQGTDYVDPFFYYNIAAASHVGIPAGAYHYFQAIAVEDAKEEASFFIEHLNTVKSKLTAPVFVDVEVNDGGLDPDTLTDAVNAFLIELENAGYTNHGVYSGISFFENNLNASRLRNTLVWIAHYGVRSAGITCDIWQYTDAGRVNGINSNVDCNESYTNLAVSNGNNTSNNNPTTIDMKSDNLGVATIEGNNVDVRDQPSMNGEVTKQVKKGESYKVFYMCQDDEQNEWLNVGGNQFIFYDSSYICFCAYIGVATIEGNNVNVRNQPSMNGEVTEQAQNREPYKVFYICQDDQQNEWLNVGGSQFIYNDSSYITYKPLESCSDCQIGY